MAAEKRELTTADKVGKVVLAFILVGIPIWLLVRWLASDSPKSAPAIFSATVIDSRVIDPSTLAVEIAVNNLSTASATPSCLVTVQNATGHYNGSTLIEGQAIEPGHLNKYTKTVTISNEGAAYITAGDVSCEKQQ